MAQAYVEIIEQPSSSGVRFRYKCEGRSAGCIRGISSSEKNRTYPTIKIHGYQGAAGCVVSCVTKDGPPYYPHPHNLLGKQSTENGICYKSFDESNMICSFSNLGIQCVKRKDIKESLLQRQQIQVDPFGTGFSHFNKLNKINLNTVRLCFQVFIADMSGKLNVPLLPVVSDPICDNKAVSDLTITKLSHKSSPVIGSQQIILLCNQVNKDDIEIVFYEEMENQITWSSQGQFVPSHVHRKIAILFFPPAYKNLNITENVDVYIQLRRPSDGATGKPEVFTYVPLTYDPDGLLRKKHKFEVLKNEDWLVTLINEDQQNAKRNIRKAVRKKTKANQSISNKIDDADIASMRPEYSVLCNNNTREMSEKHTQPSPSVAFSSAVSSYLSSSNQIAAKSTTNHILSVDLIPACQTLESAFDSSCLDLNMNDLNFDSLHDSSVINLSFSSLEIKTPSNIPSVGD